MLTFLTDAFILTCENNCQWYGSLRIDILVAFIGKQIFIKRRRTSLPNKTRFVTYSVLPYIGCYIDAADRALPVSKGLNTSSGNFTVQCINICRSSGFPYAGLQHHDECFCGTTYYKFGRVRDSECNLECSDSSGWMCGAGYRNSVYKTCKLAFSYISLNPIFVLLYEQTSSDHPLFR